ncbi:hypothetical protein MTO96_044382 [Rhipicephalus appendiculatus]
MIADLFTPFLSPVSTTYEEPHSTAASLDDENDDADVPSAVDSTSLSKDSCEPRDSASVSASASPTASLESASHPTRDGEDKVSNGGKLVPDNGTDSVAVTTTPATSSSSSESSTDDVDDEPPSAWTMWYLRKDLEWRRRAQREHESRKAALCEARAAAERKANQRSQAERAFAAWCAMKSELEAARRAEERRQSSKADEDRKRTKMRECALSERKCREWLARKQVEQGGVDEKKVGRVSGSKIRLVLYAITVGDIIRGEFGEETTNNDEQPRREGGSEPKRFQGVARQQEYDEFNGEVPRKVY